MSKQDSVNKIIEIIKKSALKFRDDFDKNVNCYFMEEKKDNEIIIHFNIKYGRDLEYLIIFRKQKIMADYIPNVKGYNKLDLSSNPYKNLNFISSKRYIGSETDEDYINWVKPIGDIKKW
mgnify:CR=1 FL=1